LTKKAYTPDPTHNPLKEPSSNSKWMSPRK
jgi:hypothetical protein